MNDRSDIAAATAKRLFGVDLDLAPRPGELEAAADMRRIFSEHAFTDSWTRTALDDQTRSLITIAILSTLGATTELRLHVHGALTLGVSPAQIAEACLHLGVYAGVPRANAAWSLAREVIESRTQQDD
ncbi:MAG: carboxymuconolactone decarboxylase family protein [Candidatus Nanopelagicales bacterium]